MITPNFASNNHGLQVGLNTGTVTNTTIIHRLDPSDESTVRILEIPSCALAKRNTQSHPWLQGDSAFAIDGVQKLTYHEYLQEIGDPLSYIDLIVEQIQDWLTRQLESTKGRYITVAYGFGVVLVQKGLVKISKSSNCNLLQRIRSVFFLPNLLASPSDEFPCDSPTHWYPASEQEHAQFSSILTDFTVHCFLKGSMDQKNHYPSQQQRCLHIVAAIPKPEHVPLTCERSDKVARFEAILKSSIRQCQYLSRIKEGYDYLDSNSRQEPCLSEVEQKFISITMDGGADEFIKATAHKGISDIYEINCKKAIKDTKLQAADDSLRKMGGHLKLAEQRLSHNYGRNCFYWRLMLAWRYARYLDLQCLSKVNNPEISKKKGELRQRIQDDLRQLRQVHGKLPGEHHIIQKMEELYSNIDLLSS